ncbi:MAG: inosine/guanosine kinase, partial [Shewanella fodinae]|nr:inosine/guanosine kinase [Shewanella fodinae]
MKFPGQRKSKHYFPVMNRDPLLAQLTIQPAPVNTWICGIDQTLVDIEAQVDEQLLADYSLPKGNSTVIDDTTAQRLYQQLQ